MGIISIDVSFCAALLCLVANNVHGAVIDRRSIAVNSPVIIGKILSVQNLMLLSLNNPLPYDIYVGCY